MSIMSPQDEQWRRKSLLAVCILQFSFLLSTTVCSKNINKQNVNIADETLRDYSFLCRYHYTKSKNYLKRRYRICHWIPMFIGTPCIMGQFQKPNSQSEAGKCQSSAMISTLYLRIDLFGLPYPYPWLNWWIKHSPNHPKVIFFRNNQSKQFTIYNSLITEITKTVIIYKFFDHHCLEVL